MNTFFKKIARRIVFPIGLSLRLEKLFSAYSHNKKLVVTYHGVSNSPNHSISVGPILAAQFEQHLKYYTENFDVVSTREIFQMHRDNYIPKKKTIAITFDDGYENNYAVVLPLLKKYNIPATMFIISQCIEDDNRLTWYDYIDIIRSHIEFANINTSVIHQPPVRSVGELRSLIKRINIENRNVLFKEIGKQVSVTNVLGDYKSENWKLMSKNQIQLLSQDPLIEIGAHSHNHPNLGEIDIADAKYEIHTSKSEIENVIQKEVYSIAFPDGSYTDAVKDACISVGFRNLFAVDSRCNSDKEDLNILQRSGISSTTTFESNMFSVHRAFKRYGF